MPHARSVFVHPLYGRREVCGFITKNVDEAIQAVLAFRPEDHTRDELLELCQTTVDLLLRTLRSESLDDAFKATVFTTVLIEISASENLVTNSSASCARSRPSRTTSA